MSRVRGEDVSSFVVKNIDALARIVINPVAGIDNPEDLPAVEELSNRSDEPMFSILFDMIFDLRDRVEAALRLEMPEPAIKEWLVVHLHDTGGDIGAIFATNLRELWNPAAEGVEATAHDRIVAFDEFAETVVATVAAVQARGGGEIHAPLAIRRPATPVATGREVYSDDSDAEADALGFVEHGRRRSEEVVSTPDDLEGGSGGGGMMAASELSQESDEVILAGVLALSITTQLGMK